MSKYTTQLRFPVEQFLTDIGQDNDEKNWKLIYDKLGLNDYPIFSEDHRQVLNDTIIRHFYFREIGQETFAQFRFILRRTMFEIMPYYNMLYPVIDDIDPLHNYSRDWDEDWNVDNTDNWSNGNKSKSDSTSNTESIYEDTPMNLLDSDSVRNLEYATNVTYNNSKDHSEAEGNATGDDVKNELGEKHHHQLGFTVSQSELFLKYREAVANIDMLVIKELESLFMGLW